MGTVDSERNIEIKARIPGGDEEFEHRLAIAKTLTNSTGEIIAQRDVFFQSQCGRLKLRYLSAPQLSQLVFYDRPNTLGPKLSKYNKIETREPEVLHKILEQSNGVLGELVKTRHLFIHTPTATRIHMDRVVGLGNFMEFEVCLKPEQTVAEGEAIAEDMIKKFGIAKADLMEGAYFDEVKTKK